MGIARFIARKSWQAFRNWRACYRVEQRFRGVKILMPTAWAYDDLDALSMGSHVIVAPFCEIVVLRNSSQSSIAGGLTIGDRTVIGAGSNIRAAGGIIKIGDDCLIAQHVSIIASNHLVVTGDVYWKLPWNETKTGVEIGNNCWIGAGAVILPGCTIGDNAVVAAGCVVTKSIPANEIWGNIPGRRLGAVPAPVRSSAPVTPHLDAPLLCL